MYLVGRDRAIVLGEDVSALCVVLAQFPQELQAVCVNVDGPVLPVLGGV